MTNEISIGGLYNQKLNPHLLWTCGIYDRTYATVIEKFDLKIKNYNLTNHFRLQDSILFVMANITETNIFNKSKLIPISEWDISHYVIQYQYKNTEAYCRLNERDLLPFLRDWEKC